MQPLNQDFLEFTKLLEKHAVDYLVVGGYAVALSKNPDSDRHRWC